MLGPAGRPGILSPLPDCGHRTESTAKSCSASWHLPSLSSAWHCQRCSRRAGRSTNGINKTYESCNEKSAAGPTSPERSHHRCRDDPRAVQSSYRRKHRVNSSALGFLWSCRVTLITPLNVPGVHCPGLFELAVLCPGEG